MRSSHLVEQVDFGERVVLDARVFDEQRHEAHVAVDGLVCARTREEGERVAGNAHARIDAHLGRDAEEARDELVRLQHACRVHLGHELREGASTVATAQRRQVERHPLAHQYLSLIEQAGRVVCVASLLNS